MVCRLYLLLSATCVMALLAEGHADCVSASWGNATESMHQIPLAIIEQGQTDEYVNLPYTSVLGCKVVGVTAVTCNPEVGATLSFVSDFTVRVHRPSAQEEGAVGSLVYCDPFPYAIASDTPADS